MSFSPSELWIRFKFQELSAGQTAEKTVVVTVPVPPQPDQERHDC